MVPLEELKRRVEGFQQVLQTKGVDGALLVQRADTLYFCGTAQNVHVYIPAAGQPVIMAYRDVNRAQEESPWEVFPLPGLSKIPQLIAEAELNQPEILGLEYDVLPVASYERYRRVFAEVKFVDISYALRIYRAVKSPWEITKIEEAGEIYSELCEFAPTILRPGITEIEFEGLLEAKARMLGHETMVRVRGVGSELHFGGVTAGARATVPSYFDGPITGLGVSYTHPMGPSHTTIEPGEPIIMDLVIVKHGYHIDTTRVLVLGELDEDFYKAYEVSLKIEEYLLQALVPGSMTGEIYEEIMAWVKKETPYAENFMGYGSSQVRFIGHGIGLEVDELPTISRGSKEILQPGMTLALEPKFVFPGLGAIGIEDTVVVEGPRGARFLCQAPREIIKI